MAIETAQAMLWLNEKQIPWRPGQSLAALRSAHKPDADIAILDGFPVDSSAWAATIVGPNSRVALIRRGERPSHEELRAFARARHTPGLAELFQKSSVGIAGLGGLGSHAAYALARLGVGRLALADHDIVEPSNLNRQAYRVEQLGMPKAEALAADLRQANPTVEIVAKRILLHEHNVAECFAGCQVVLECVDRPETKRALVQALLRQMPANVWIVAASGLAGLGGSNRIRSHSPVDRLVVVGDGTAAAAPGRGLMAPRVMLAAAHQANAAAQIIVHGHWQDEP